MTRLDLIKRLPPNSSVAEIGVLFGDFSAEILTTSVARLYLVDPWIAAPDYTDTWKDFPLDQAYRKVRARFNREIVSGRVKLIRLPSANAAVNADIPPLDAVFIDADHTYLHVLQDLMLWEKRLKPGGVLMGHDYLEHADWGVIRACETFCHSSAWELDCVTHEKDWPSFCLRRRT